MDAVGETLLRFWESTGVANFTYQSGIMIVVSLFFLYLAIRHGFEPLLLVPIAFGMLLSNLPMTGIFINEVVHEVFTHAGIAEEAPFPLGTADAVAENQQIILILLRITGGQIDQSRLGDFRPVTVIIFGRILDPLNQTAILNALSVLHGQLLRKVRKTGLRKGGGGETEQADKQEKNQEQFHEENLLTQNSFSS